MYKDYLRLCRMRMKAPRRAVSGPELTHILAVFKKVATLAMEVKLLYGYERTFGNWFSFTVDVGVFPAEHGAYDILDEIVKRLHEHGGEELVYRAQQKAHTDYPKHEAWLEWLDGIACDYGGSDEWNPALSYSGQTVGPQDFETGKIVALGKDKN